LFWTAAMKTKRPYCLMCHAIYIYAKTTRPRCLTRRPHCLMCRAIYIYACVCMLHMRSREAVPLPPHPHDFLHVLLKHQRWGSACAPTLSESLSLSSPAQHRKGRNGSERDPHRVARRASEHSHKRCRGPALSWLRAVTSSEKPSAHCRRCRCPFRCRCRCRR
jgi:hypothetical protein